jgi:uncharacterized RmlC-like cupin family protein
MVSCPLVLIERTVLMVLSGDSRMIKKLERTVFGDVPGDFLLTPSSVFLSPMLSKISELPH